MEGQHLDGNGVAGLLGEIAGAEIDGGHAYVPVVR